MFVCARMTTAISPLGTSAPATFNLPPRMLTALPPPIPATASFDFRASASSSAFQGSSAVLGSCGTSALLVAATASIFVVFDPFVLVELAILLGAPPESIRPRRAGLLSLGDGQLLDVHPIETHLRGQGASLPTRLNGGIRQALLKKIPSRLLGHVLVESCPVFHDRHGGG
jgi:hypothetical protein